MDINDNYKQLFRIRGGYIINDLLLLFPTNRLVLSTGENKTLINNFENLSLVEHIPNSDKYYTNKLLYWHYHHYNSYLIIFELNDKSITGYNLYKKEQFLEISASKESGGYINGNIEDNSLIAFSSNGIISIININHKNVVKSIDLKISINHSLEWNNKYYIISDSNSIKVLDIKFKENDIRLISKITNNNKIIGILKIYDPEYEESLLVVNENETVFVMSTY